MSRPRRAKNRSTDCRSLPCKRLGPIETNLWMILADRLQGRLLQLEPHPIGVSTICSDSGARGRCGYCGCGNCDDQHSDHRIA